MDVRRQILGGVLLGLAMVVIGGFAFRWFLLPGLMPTPPELRVGTSPAEAPGAVGVDGPRPDLATRRTQQTTQTPAGNRAEAARATGESPSTPGTASGVNRGRESRPGAAGPRQDAAGQQPRSTAGGPRNGATTERHRRGPLFSDGADSDQPGDGPRQDRAPTSTAPRSASAGTPGADDASGTESGAPSRRAQITEALGRAAREPGSVPPERVAELLAGLREEIGDTESAGLRLSQLESMARLLGRARQATQSLKRIMDSDPQGAGLTDLTAEEQQRIGEATESLTGISRSLLEHVGEDEETSQ